MRFGDIVENLFASANNPCRIGIFVKRIGKNWEFTDGKGEFWIHPSGGKELVVIGRGFSFTTLIELSEQASAI